MKKLLFMLLSVAMLFAFAACNSKPPVEDDDQIIEEVEQQPEVPSDLEEPVDEEQPNGEEIKVDPPAEKPEAKPQEKPAEKPGTGAPQTPPEVKPEEKPAEKPQSPAKILLQDFKTRVNGGEKNIETLAANLIQNSVIPFMGGSVPVEPGFLNGFSSEITGFSKGVMFGPNIGTIPFIGYLFEVDTDVNAFIQTLKDNADLRWNICTSADEMVVDSIGNTVFFLMAPAQFEE